MALNHLNKGQKTAITVIGLSISLFGLYLSIFNSFNYKSKNEIIGFVLFFIPIFICLMIGFNIKKYTESKIDLFIIVVITTFIIFFIMQFRKLNLEYELEKYGIETSGKVINFETEKRKTYSVKYAVFKYVFKTKINIQRIDNNDFNFKIDQNFKLRISKRKPEMFKITEPKK
jgi:hypothetical protein